MDYFDSFIIRIFESDGHDTEYLNILKNLKADIETALTVLEKEKIFDTFVYKYTVIPALWDLMIQMQYSYKFVQIEKYLKQPLPDLYFHISLFNNTKYSLHECYPWKHKILFSKVYENLRDYDSIPQDNLLTFPHSQLENEYNKCDEYSNHPIPKEVLQKYTKAKEFAKRLLDKNLSDEKWIEMLFKWDDPKFAIQQIESKLITEIWNKSLWKAYINAMETRNLKIMLNICHRYTRLFLSDIEMKEKYENLRMNSSENIDEYENLIELESYLFDEISSKPEKYNYFLSTFKYSQMQCYSLPEAIIHYIKCVP